MTKKSAHIDFIIERKTEILEEYKQCLIRFVLTCCMKSDTMDTTQSDDINMTIVRVTSTFEEYQKLFDQKTFSDDQMNKFPDYEFLAIQLEYVLVHSDLSKHPKRTRNSG